MWEGAGDDPPCDTCFPGVHKWNQAAATIYNACANQYVSTPGGVSGLDLRAVEIAMDWHRVPEEDRSDIWRKVQVITDALIQECRDEAERKAQEKKRNK